MEDRLKATTEYSEIQIDDIILFHNQGFSWEEVAAKFNKKYNTEKSSNSVRHIYRAYKDLFNQSDKDVDVNTLKEVQRTKKNNSKTQKHNRIIIQQLLKEEEILEDIRDLVAELNKQPTIKIKKLPSNKKKRMTIESLFSDIHFGKKTDTFDLKKCRERLRHYVSVKLREIFDRSKLFNVERLIVAFLGDLIESATMHGLESLKGCEFGNSKQVQEAIRSLFEDVLTPFAGLGIPIDVVCVTGNHDRTEAKRTYHNPGEENLTWIIYNTLEMLSEQAGWKHVKFQIARGPYATLDIYGKTCLYEHYDNAGSNTRKALEELMMKRQKQVGKVISFMRGGHYHEATVYGRGTIITNGSVCGQDSFADVLGFDTEAVQIINFYIETKTRPTPFYSSFPVFLP